MYYNPMTNNTNYMYNNAGMYQQGIPASPIAYQQPIGYGMNYGGYYQQPIYQQQVINPQYQQQLSNQQQLQNYNIQMNMLMHKTPEQQQQVQLTPLYSQEQTNQSVDLAGYTRQSINNDIAKLQAYENQVAVQGRPQIDNYQMYQQQQFNEAYQKQLALNQMIAQNQYRENMMGFNQVPMYSSFGNIYQQTNYDMYNPYLQYQNLYIEQNREALNTQVNILQRLYKASCCYNETEVDQENLDYIRGLYFPNEKKNDYYDGYRNIPPALMERKRHIEQLNANSMHLSNANLTDCTGKNPELLPYINYINNLYTEYRNKIPNNVGMIEYFNKYASDDYMDALNSEYMKKVQNLTNAYNSSAYKDSITSNIPIYGKALQDPNMIRGLEDVEVKLPTYISDATRQQRRAQFIASLMNKGEL